MTADPSTKQSTVETGYRYKIFQYIIRMLSTLTKITKWIQTNKNIVWWSDFIQLHLTKQRKYLNISIHIYLINNMDIIIMHIIFYIHNEHIERIFSWHFRFTTRRRICISIFCKMICQSVRSYSKLMCFFTYFQEDSIVGVTIKNNFTTNFDI